MMGHRQVDDPHADIELMEDVNTGLREIDETGEILKELAKSA
jgi:hypothetical protein